MKFWIVTSLAIIIALGFYAYEWRSCKQAGGTLVQYWCVDNKTIIR